MTSKPPYTGLNDKNDVGIYEGDILGVEETRYSYFDVDPPETEHWLGRVVSTKGAFWVVYDDGERKDEMLCDVASDAQVLEAQS